MPAPSPANSRPGGADALPRCAVCGAGSRQAPFRSNPAEQAPDLDLRPGEPVRSTMARWLQQCPSCGYAAPNIGRAHPAAAQAVSSASFEKLSKGRERGQEDVTSFYRKGIAGDWKNYFTERDKEIYKEEAGELLIRLGYERDLDW